MRKAGRGSRPGFSSSAMMSVTVGRPKLSSAKLRRVEGAQGTGVADQGADGLAGGGQDAAHHRIGLRMDGRGVEGVVAAPDAQEAGRELEGLGPEAGDLLQAGAGAERALRVAFDHDVARHPLGRGPRPERAGGPRRCSRRRRQRSRSLPPRRPGPSRADPRSRSCWYCPTPIALGSIFTSSASGSCRRRAMETAPRRETSSPGNSALAYAEAE